MAAPSCTVASGCVPGFRHAAANPAPRIPKRPLGFFPAMKPSNRMHPRNCSLDSRVRTFEQVLRDQKSEKVPVNKGQNQFFDGKSPTSLGEEPYFICDCGSRSEAVVLVPLQALLVLLGTREAV